jgi:DNA-binding NarL/FixJ family response regulator
MDDNELGRSGELESDDVGLAFRVEEAHSRLWTRPVAVGRDALDGPYAAELAADVACSDARALAIECDRTLSTDFDVAELWRRLGAGEWRVRDTFATGNRLYAVVEGTGCAGRTPANDAGLAMIEQVLLGQSSKAVAIDLQVSDSTVALAIRRRLQLMGLVCKVRAVPLILAMAARAACRRPPRIVRGKLAALTDGSPTLAWVISVSHPDFRLPDWLSSAERAVLLQVLEGKTYVQIAAERARSMRTVANQLGSVFRKLGVSGYGQTLDWLLSRSLEAPAGVPLERHPRHAPLRSRSSLPQVAALRAH